MASNDPSLLSAYLDDELDADARRQFEAALGQHPELREELEALRTVQETVRNLPRPISPRDLGLDVVRAIESRGLRAPRPVLVRHPGPVPWVALGSLSAVAALLLLAWVGHVLEPTPPTRPDLPSAPVSIAQADPAPPPAPTGETPSLTPPAEEPPTPPVLIAEAVPKPTSEFELPDPERATRQPLAELLGMGPPRRVVLTVDRLDAPTINRIEHLIADAARLDPRHIRLSLEAGVPFDPTLPAQALVYILPLRPSEAQDFEARLAAAFAERLEPAAVAPSVLANLLETPGPISFHQSAPRSLVRASDPLAPLGSESALRALRLPDPNDEPIIAPITPLIPNRPPSEPHHDSPQEPNPRRGTGPASTERADDQPLTFLLWVTEQPAAPRP
ncbi:MAG: hypothetical protein KatS3mg108_1855 [Isosphaeraceae bacterium]|jgi:hypothetical protein|nr:MAG: hypothetical protein KatS3mg108_1855 [Isosphaeraceae bacterium]